MNKVLVLKANTFFCPLKNKMKNLTVLFITILFSVNLHAQKITNFILVGEKGITKNIKEAKSFIMIKKFPDGSFERKDYLLYGPLKVMKTYSDSSLSILNGMFCSYRPDGSIKLSGHYINNKMENEWYRYNDTGKVILIENYVGDTLVNSKIPDTTIDDKLVPLKEGEKEAAYIDGNAALKNFLIKNINAHVAEKSVKGGQVRVAFKIDTVGKVTLYHLRKSVEFILDEEALRVIAKMPDWIPAEQEGKKVNAYRIQPLTFAVN
jgi:periplasmic protein TonB